MEWVEDSTNTDTTITRNAIRKQLQSYTKAEIDAKFEQIMSTLPIATAAEVNDILNGEVSE